MRPIYKLFYRERGIRYSNLLAEPPAFQLDVFPKNSIFHSYTLDPSAPEVDTSKPYLKGYAKKILIDYVTDYVNSEGLVRKPIFDIKRLTMGWRRENRLSYTWDGEALLSNANPEVLGVINYGYLDVIYKYIPHKMIPYWRWVNRQRTIYTKMNEIAQKSQSHQFMFYPIASVLQGRTILDKFSQKEASVQMVEIIGSTGEGGFFQLDLWKWISAQTRNQSLLSLIEPKHYSKINFIFISSSGKQCLVNLGWLNSWIKGQPNMTELSSVTQYDTRPIQNLWLKLSMSLNGVSFEEENESSAPVDEVKLSGEQTVVLDEEESDDNQDDEDVVDDRTLHVEATKPPVLKAPKPLADPESDTEPFQKMDQSLLKSLEDDIEALDRVSLLQLKNKVKQPSAILKDDSLQPEKINVLPETRPVITQYMPPSAKLKAMIAENAEANLLTAAEYRKLLQSVDTYQSSENPYTGKGRRIEDMVIKPEEIAIKKEETLIPIGEETPDKAMGESTLYQFDRKYIRTVLKKDLLNVVDSIQAAGVVVRRHEVDIKHTVLGGYEHHRLELKPIDGQPSTIQFTLPVLNDDGTFESNGNKYLLRKQRVDIPVRKIAPKIVSLSSYYGKTFVQSNMKVSNDSVKWLCRELTLSAYGKTGLITQLNPGNVFDNEFEAPWIYNALAENFDRFMVGDHELIFDHRERTKLVNPELLKVIEKDGRRWCGWTKQKHPIVVDKRDHFLRLYKEDVEDLGTAAEYFGFNLHKKPIDFAEVRIFSKYIPLGLVLGYYMGLDWVLNYLNASYREVLPRKNKDMAVDEYAISFKDVSYVFKTTNKVSTLILAGLADYEKEIKQYDRELFDTPDVYFNLLQSKGMNATYLRELDMMQSAFIDPITKEILESRGEPTWFVGLLIYAVQMLTTYTHPASQDRRVMRDRGYERFAGFAYKEIMQAVRQYKNRNVSGRSKIEMSPYQVWNAVMKDNSVKIVEDINPIQNLKEAEVFTYSGQGGRDKDTMTKPTRAFHASDVGVVSESSVDSSAVGTIAYMTPNAQIKNLRGELKENVDLTPTSMLSTSVLISPCATNDAVKRQMFICTQHSHTIASSAYRQPYLRTGYEFVIGKRTSDLFSMSAEEDGVVISVNDSGMVVEYASGLRAGVELGRRYGQAEGTTYPHDVVTPYKAGARFKKGTVLAYNTKFFEPDFIDPTNIILKTSGVVRTAFIEGAPTHEDASTISPEAAQRFSTEVMKIKSYIVKFVQNIEVVKPAGSKVEPRDVLMIIEDEITADHPQFDKEALATLARLSNMSPRAGVLGSIDRYEVFYHGDKQDMSESLKALADKSDQQRAARLKAIGKPVVTGRVNNDYRVKGTPLELDQAEIKIYISVKSGTGVGDKPVFGHQMKSTVSEVHRGAIHTESGDSVDATFSYRSLANRIVLSPALMGTTITLLDAIGKQAAKLYLGENDEE